jgi:hypothetical protein
MKVRKAEEGENGMIVFKSLMDFKANDNVFDNIGLGNDVYLAYNGFVKENNIHDCVEVAFTFTERREDKLSNERVKFFQKYFMFDRTHIDVM